MVEAAVMQFSGEGSSACAGDPTTGASGSETAAVVCEQPEVSVLAVAHPGCGLALCPYFPRAAVHIGEEEGRSDASRLDLKCVKSSKLPEHVLLTSEHLFPFPGLILAPFLGKLVPVLE